MQWSLHFMKINFKKIYKKFDRGVLDIGKQLDFVWKFAEIRYVFEKIASQGDWQKLKFSFFHLLHAISRVRKFSLYTKITSQLYLLLLLIKVPVLYCSSVQAIYPYVWRTKKYFHLLLGLLFYGWNLDGTLLIPRKDPSPQSPRQLRP